MCQYNKQKSTKKHTKMYDLKYYLLYKCIKLQKSNRIFLENMQEIFERRIVRIS